MYETFVVVDGDFVPGVIFYALRECHSPEASFPFADWVGATSFRHSVLGGEAWEIDVWDVAVRDWPDPESWISVLKRTFKAMLTQGAVVAWLDSEGTPFSSPPYLFSPHYMHGAVLAALTSAGDFFCSYKLGEPVSSLSDSELEVLRSHAAGLADAD